MSTDIYKDAIAEAKKLRQIAEEDAKRSIAEEIAPLIKKVISEQIDGATHSQFFIEQEEEEDPLALDDPSQQDLSGLEPGGETVADPATVDTTPIDSLAPGLGDEPEAAPVAANGEDILSATMPDEEGKITVDFEDLFSDVEDGSTPDAGLDLGEPLGGAEAPPLTPGEVPPGDEAGALDTGADASGDLGGLELPPEEEEQPLAAESKKYKNFQKTFNEVSEKVDRVFFKDSVNELVHESLKTSLFTLLEQNDKFKNEGILTNKMAKTNENKLEFLFLKLKEANLNNSYTKEDQRTKSMTSLKEYAVKLFEEDSTYAEDGDKEGTNQPTTASGKHAADVSGVDPNLGSSGPEDLEGREEDGNSGAIKEEMLPGTAGSVDHEPLPNTDPKPGSEEQWASGKPSMDEEDQDKVIEEALSSLEEEVEAEGHAGFGDTNENPPVEFEVDEKEIAEAVRNIRKKSIQEKMNALREASDGSDSTESWEDAEPEGGDDPSHDNLKESAEVKDGENDESLNEMDLPGMNMEDDELNGEDDFGGEEEENDYDADDDMGDMDDMGAGGDGDLVLNIDLPDAVEDALASVDIADMGDVQVSLADVNLGDESGDVGVEDSISDVVSDGPVPPGRPVDDVVMHDDMDDMEESYQAEKAVYEAKLKKAGKAYRSLKEQNEKLKSDLREANLFLAKNVYFTKFLQKENLSRKNLTKIVDYLDGAKTVSEAKTIYGKIKAKLTESAKASKKLAGSAAQATKSGSAHTLKESVSRKDSSDPVVNSVSRWQQLAGVKAKKS